MKYAYAFCVLLLFAPIISNAVACSNDATIIYVNGMFAESEAYVKQDKSILESIYRKNAANSTTSEGVKFDYAYNPSRFLGGGESWKVVLQSYMPGNYIRDNDFHNIVNKLHGEVQTKRILLVGHSQGTFYTNLLYQYYIENGVPPESIGVFNIATPASYVAGGGTYVTSDSDNVMNSAREVQALGGAPQALPANISIGSMPGDETTGLFFGHNLRTVYIPGVPKRIAEEINTAAQRLKAASADYYPCLPSNDKPLTHIGQQAGLAVAQGAYIAGYGVVKTIDYTGKALYAVSTATLDMTTYAAHRGAGQLIAVGNTTISAAQFTYNTSRAIVGASMNLASSVLFSTPVQAQSSAAVLAVVPSIATPETELYHPVTFEPLPNVQPEVVPPQPVLSEEPITWEYIPERDASYISAVAVPHTVVSTPVTGSAPGGSEVYIDVPSPLPQPIILTGGAGQGGGGAPTLEPSAPVLTPLTCASPEVLNADSTACVIPDTTPPTLAVTLSGCLSLVATDTTMSCLAHTSSTPTLSWVAEAGSTVSLNGVVVTDTSVSLVTGAILTAADTAGNVATKNITITSDATPLLISEVGYPLDTPQDTAHQYVELYNTTNTALDISALYLESSRTAGDPALPQFSLPLAGTIQPHSYFLITNDFDIADTVEDMTTAWPNGFTNTSSLPHQLLLKQGTAVLDSFELSCPTLSTTCHTTGHPFALERSIRRSFAVDYAYSLEQNNAQFMFTSGTTRFIGSPGRRNTANYVVSTLSDTLTAEYNPYYIDVLEVPAGATGTIDSGVILTMRSGGGIHINGTLIINGTATNPVVLSSADRWSGLAIASGGNLSAAHTTVSNAGIGNSGSDTGAVKNRGGVVFLSDVTMTDVQPNGFFQDDGSATLTNVSITTTTYPENAVKVRGGTFIFDGGILSNFSDFGFHITGTPMCTISNIVITGVRNARTNGSDTLCSWNAVTHNGSPL